MGVEATPGLVMFVLLLLVTVVWLFRQPNVFAQDGRGFDVSHAAHVSR